MKLLYPEVEELYIDMIADFLLYHLEEKIRKEVLFLEDTYDHETLVLDAPYDDVYWRYLIAFMELTQGRMELYRENQKLFEQAWENFCRQVFIQKENFKLSSFYLKSKKKKEGV